MRQSQPYYFEHLELADLSRGSSRFGWLTAGFWVAVLISSGFVVALATRFVGWEYTLSFRASMLYVIVGTIIIVFLGYGRFPIAAGIYYGFLPLAQASHAHHFVLGDVDHALTFEMLFAAPLIFMGLVGPRAADSVESRPLPAALKAGFVFILVSGVISSVHAASPAVAFSALAGRFVIPIAVMLACYRRLRGIDDYKTLWFGFAIGIAAIAFFDFRRSVMGYQVYERALNVNQRYLGATQSFAIPVLFVTGGALWLGVARAQAGAVLRGVLWLLLVGMFGIIIWLGAARGPTLGLALLLLWWLPGNVLTRLHRPMVWILVIIGGAVLLYLVRFSMESTALETGLVLDRLGGLFGGDVTREGRWSIWATAINIWKDSPLLGMGPNNWVVYNPKFESVHSMVVGFLFDLGIFGLLVFMLFFAVILWMARKPLVAHLPWQDRMFFLGCRAGWVVMMLVLAVNLPLTSGQPRNYIFVYAAYMFPMMVMTLYARRPSSYYVTQYVPQPGGHSQDYRRDARSYAQPAFRPLS